MTRLLVLWTRANHLSPEEAERWVRAETRALLDDGAVESAALTRLESASPRHSSDWQWMLELEITAPAPECLERGRCAEWLADLRLLGMRPVVAVAGAPIALDGGDG